MIELRPYQINGISELREAYRNHNRILFIAPTGSGKTVVFSSICAAAIERGKTVLILSDRMEIFAQTIKTLAHHEIPVCKINADNSYISKDAKLFVGMVETFKRRMDRYSHIKFDLLIFDEAHKATFNKVMDAYQNTKTLGCTATPVGKTLHKYYTHLIQTIDIPELIEQGFLSPCKGFAMQDDFSDLKTDKSGEYTEASQFSHFHKSKLYDGVIEKYLEVAKGRKCLVFNCNIEHAENTTKAFNAAGIKSYCISSHTSDQERAWILSEYDRGAFLVLNNANILVAGYDNPSIECIIMNRATGVINVWLQAAGRGSRIFPGKSFFTLLDFGGNFDRHGLWCEARKWKLEAPKKRKKGLGAMPVKSCKQCGAMMSAQVRQCEYCGFIFQPTEAELAQGRLVEVTNRIRERIPGKYVSQLTVPELVELEKTKQMKPAYVWRVIRSKGTEALYQYAEIKGHRPEWAARQLEAMEHEGVTQFADKKINEIEML